MANNHGMDFGEAGLRAFAHPVGLGVALGLFVGKFNTRNIMDVTIRAFKGERVEIINEGADGRVFELTPDKEIVWEYVSPYFGKAEPNRHHIFRAYRVPYEWVPQLRRPRERAVVPPDRAQFRIAPR